MRYVLGKVQSVLELKLGFRVTTAEVYAAWARKNGADVLTDKLPEGATLHWIGPRRKDRVLLYLHGAHFSLYRSMLIKEGSAGTFRRRFCYSGPG
jgi:hypothetical protein